MSYKKPSAYSYSLDILKLYPEHAKIKLAKKVLLKHDYDSFNQIIYSMDNPYVLLDKLLNALDIPAIELLLNRGKSSPEHLMILEEYCSFQRLFSDDYSDDYSLNYDNELNSKEKNIKIAKVIKLLLEFQEAENITTEILQHLTFFLSKEEFYKFTTDKEIDLNNEKFQDFKPSIYILQETLPILFQKYSLDDFVFKRDTPDLNILDILLSRTYSSKLKVEEISNIYRSLYNLSSIAKEILHYTAALISKGNSIKILFGDDIDTTNYNPISNHIQIDNKFSKETIFNIESVLIHELGHYIYEQVFEADSQPFDFKELREFVNQHRENLDDPYVDDSIIYQLIFNDSKILEYKNLFQSNFEYEKVARKPIELAAKLLGINIKSLDEYISSNDLAEYFKDHSYIDLFYLNTAQTLNYAENIDIGVFDNVYNIYLAEHNLCYAESYPLIYAPTISKKDVIHWSQEEFLPELVNKLKLTPTQIHFLERIADYVNRGTHLLDEKGREEDDYERHAELIVRSSELRAAKVEPEIIESFKGLEEIHIKTASPKICSYILESEVASLPFEVGMVGETYSCLTV